MVTHAPPGTEVHVTGDGSGAACWHPPGAGQLPAGVRGGVPGAWSARLRASAPRWCSPASPRFARRAPAEPHWHLAAVGVAPERRGEGLGARLLAPMLARCDRLGLPAYLESSNSRNVAFYERLGFATCGEVRTVDERVTLTLMWRPPAPANGPTPMTRIIGGEARGRRLKVPPRRPGAPHHRHGARVHLRGARQHR